MQYVIPLLNIMHQSSAYIFMLLSTDSDRSVDQDWCVFNNLPIPWCCYRLAQWELHTVTVVSACGNASFQYKCDERSVRVASIWPWDSMMTVSDKYKLCIHMTQCTVNATVPERSLIKSDLLTHSPLAHNCALWKHILSSGSYIVQ